MPRPIARKGRLPRKNAKGTKQNLVHMDRENGEMHPTPERENIQNNVPIFSLSVQNDVPAPETGRRVESGTPTVQAHEPDIWSSPVGEGVGGADSRPPSRARGYSSTMSLAGGRGDMGSRVPGTPSSILSNFRRRPRQPSILQMMQADDVSSGLDDDEDDDFLGGFSPQDESTPLRHPSGKPLTSKSAISSSLVPSVYAAEGSKTEQHHDGKAASKRASPSVDRHAAAQPTSGAVEDERDDSSIADVQQQTARLSGAMMAAPISSPLSGTTGDTGTRKSNLRVTRESEPNESDAHLPTAALQQRLLPQRRQRKHGRNADFDLASDDFDSDSERGQDDDELAYLPMRGSSRARTNRKGKTAVRGRTGLGDAVARQGRKKSRTDGLRNASKLARSRGPVTDVFRSGKYAGPGKENRDVDLSPPLDSHDLQSPTSSPGSTMAFISEEIRLQAEKFAVIDRWEMEFETVSDTGSG